MKCLYYLARTLESTRRISDDVRAVGVSDSLLHVITRDEAGLQKEHIHSSNYLETLDLIRDGLIGAALGLIFGVIGVGLLQYFQPFGPAVARVVYFATVAVALLFGAWEGGLTGIATENRKLAGFHDDIERGGYLILIYAPRDQEAAVRTMMCCRHREAELAAIDRHFMNPFRVVQRSADSPQWRGELVQED
ncbi:MAG TPA: hypothetical protein VE266_10000 [Steroidobacteraceae bacterium]|nr:hypothetical protein [Steroidobacteraceae bacterium]